MGRLWDDMIFGRQAHYERLTWKFSTSPAEFCSDWGQAYVEAMHEHLWDVFCCQWLLVSWAAIIGKE